MAHTAERFESAMLLQPDKLATVEEYLLADIEQLTRSGLTADNWRRCSMTLEGFEEGRGAVVEVEIDQGYLRLPVLALVQTVEGFAFVMDAYFSTDDVRNAHRLECELTHEAGIWRFTGEHSGIIEAHDGAEFPGLLKAIEHARTLGLSQADIRESFRAQLAD